MKKYKINSFFAGIGGFDIAFEKHGFKTAFLCEINPFCNDILTTHWPDVPKHLDISTLNPKNIPAANVWCGGFPCQDISVARGASERKGLKGERSGLFYTYANLIEQRLPNVVIMENVEGLFSSNEGRDFGMILQRMTNLGYSVCWRLVNSRYFGVPQSRTRVYICCWKESLTKSVHVMFEPHGAAVPQHGRIDFMTESNEDGEFPKVPKVAYCLAASSGRHTGTDWSRTYVVAREGVRRLTPLESERLQGFPDGWTVPFGCDVDSDNTDTLRYTAIGNAVSVPVVEWIAKRIYEQLSFSCDEMSKEDVISYIPEFAHSEWKQGLNNFDFTDCSQKFKWSKAGVAWGDSFISGDVKPTPNSIVESSLFSLVEKSPQNSRYYLSSNAAEGILRRVDRQGRKLFQPLRVALEIEASKKNK